MDRNARQLSRAHVTVSGDRELLDALLSLHNPVARARALAGSYQGVGSPKLELEVGKLCIFCFYFYICCFLLEFGVENYGFVVSNITNYFKGSLNLILVTYLIPCMQV